MHAHARPTLKVRTDPTQQAERVHPYILRLCTVYGCIWLAIHSPIHLSRAMWPCKKLSEIPLAKDSESFQRGRFMKPTSLGEINSYCTTSFSCFCFNLKQHFRLFEVVFTLLAIISSCHNFYKTTLLSRGLLLVWNPDGRRKGVRKLLVFF